MVYWIRLLKADESADSVDDNDMASAWRTPPDYRRQTASLIELVELSGGKIIPARNPDEIKEVFAEILLELREQYALGYYPTRQRNDGSWRRVKVKIGRSGVKARTHEGYIDL